MTEMKGITFKVHEDMLLANRVVINGVDYFYAPSSGIDGIQRSQSRA